MQKQPNSQMCFVCGLENPIGLKMAFYEAGPGQLSDHLGQVELGNMLRWPNKFQPKEQPKDKASLGSSREAILLSVAEMSAATAFVLVLLYHKYGLFHLKFSSPTIYRTFDIISAGVSPNGRRLTKYIETHREKGPTKGAPLAGEVARGAWGCSCGLLPDRQGSMEGNQVNGRQQVVDAPVSVVCIAAMWAGTRPASTTRGAGRPGCPGHPGQSAEPGTQWSFSCRPRKVCAGS
jgi:hypothetical protein